MSVQVAMATATPTPTATATLEEAYQKENTDHAEVRCDCGCNLFLLENTHGFVFRETKTGKIFREWKLRDGLWFNFLHTYALPTWGELKYVVIANKTFHTGRRYFQEYIWLHLYNALCLGAQEQDVPVLDDDTVIEWLAEEDE